MASISGLFTAALRIPSFTGEVDWIGVYFGSSELRHKESEFSLSFFLEELRHKDSAMVGVGNPPIFLLKVPALQQLCREHGLPSGFDKKVKEHRVL